MTDNDYKEKYEDLLKENELLHGYLHDYQQELEKYSSCLEQLDKCTAKEERYAQIDLQRKLARHDAIVKALWESVDWIAEPQKKAADSPWKMLNKFFWFLSPARIYFLLSLYLKKFEGIKRFHDRHGLSRTIDLLAPLPLYASLRGRAWTELARHNGPGDSAAALECAILAWRADPRPYRLKFLAFNMFRKGENARALALLEALPANLPFSESEMRMYGKIKSLCQRASRKSEAPGEEKERDAEARRL